MSVSSTPNLPVGQSTRSSSEVKSATPDLIIEDPSIVPIEIIEKLIFENISGQELLLLSRHDTIGGQQTAAQKIQNLTDINFKYGSDTILNSTESFKNYFKNFPIFLEASIPDLENNQFAPNAYVSATTGDIVIEFKDLKPEQQVETQTISSSSVFDDIIY